MCAGDVDVDDDDNNVKSDNNDDKNDKSDNNDDENDNINNDDNDRVLCALEGRRVKTLVRATEEDPWSAR